MTIEKKFTLTELREFYNSKHYMTEDRFFWLFNVRKGVDLSMTKDWYKTYLAFPFNITNNAKANDLKVIMQYIVEYIKERDDSFSSKTPYTLESKSIMVEIYYREKNSDQLKNVMIDLYKSSNILCYADLIKRTEILLQLPMVDKHYIGQKENRNNGEDLYFFEGDVYHSKDNFWSNKKGNVYIATGKCFKRLNYIKGVGYLDSKGNPNYDGSSGSFSSYAITGIKYEKLGNIHVDTNFLKD